MIEVFTLEVDLCAAQILCHFLCIVQARRTPDVVVEHVRELLLKRRIPAEAAVGVFKFFHRIHEGFRDVLTAMNSKASVYVSHGLFS